MSSRGNVNKIILVGNLGHEPELRCTPKGNSVLSLSVATNRDFKTAEGIRKSETCWHKATVWGKRAENCAKFLTKGSRVYLEGELHSSSYTDKEGIERRTMEVWVNDICFLGGTIAPAKQSQSEEEQVPALAH